MDIPETGAIFTLGKSNLAENAQSYFFIKNDPVKRLVSGANQSAVICESGRLFVWGENQFGQLGIGNSNDVVMKPTCVKSLKSLGLKICDIDFGMGWSVILTQTNDIFFTGRNIFPKDTRIFSNFVDVEISNEKYLIIRKPIRLIEFDEMIGDNNQKDEIFERIAAGNDHFVVLTSHGRLFAWGTNESNQLGLPDPFYSQPIEIVLNNRVKMFTCGLTSTLILNDKNQLFLAGQLNDYHFEKFTELTSNENVIEISFLYISKANEIFITTESGNIYRGGVSMRNKNFNFQKFYDYDNEDYGPVKKLLKGSSFFAALTKANKFFTTFSESGHHLKTFREISKFKNLRILDVTVGDRHILVLGIPKSSDSRRISSSSSEVNNVLNKSSIEDVNGNLKSNLLHKRISEEAEDLLADDDETADKDIKNKENEAIKPNSSIGIARIKEEVENGDTIEEICNEIVNEAIIKKEKMENGKIKEVGNIEEEETNEKEIPKEKTKNDKEIVNDENCVDSPEDNNIKEKMENNQINKGVNVDNKSNDKTPKKTDENIKTDSENQSNKINDKQQSKKIDSPTNNNNVEKSPKKMAENLTENQKSDENLTENQKSDESDTSEKSENLKNQIIKNKSFDEIEDVSKSYYKLCDDDTIEPTAPPTESPDIEHIKDVNEKNNIIEKLSENFKENNNLDTNKVIKSDLDDQPKIETENLSKTEEDKSKYLEILKSEPENIFIPTSDRYRKFDTESSEEISDSTESKTPESIQSTSTVKLAPLKKSRSTVSPMSVTQETPKGSVRSIKFDQHSLKSQKSSDRLIRPRTPYPDGTPQTVKHIKLPDDKIDLEEEEDLLEKTSPNFADSLENTPRPLNDDFNSAVALRNWTKHDIKDTPTTTMIVVPKSEKIEEITTQSSGDKSYIIKQRYSDDKSLMTTTDDDEELEVEVKSNKINLDNEPDEIRFINDGIDVTENVVRNLAMDSSDLIEKEASKSEKILMKNLNDTKSKFVDSITDIKTDDILTTPDNSVESKIKTLSSNIEDDERTTASANSIKTLGENGGNSGNPFENDLDENCDKIVEENSKNIVEVGGKGKTKVKRFINGIKNTGKVLTCRTNNSVKVEDEPPKYTPIDEHLEGTSRVCTIL